MKFRYYLLFIPYSIAWYIYRYFRKECSIVIYCANLTEWYVLEPLAKQLKEAIIVSGNRYVLEHLRSNSIPVRRGPFFPKVVIMCCNYLDRFPCKEIIKIGMRFGAYNFIRTAKDKQYSNYDLYLFTSKADRETLRNNEQVNGKVVGFPKLDPAINGSFNEQYLSNLRKRLNLNQAKTTILLTSTWYRSELSAIREWYKRLKELVNFYNVLVTLHPGMDKRFIRRIQKTKGAIFIDKDNIVPHIMLADVCIGDSGSIIAECSALDKPIITFNVKHQSMIEPETDRLIKSISYPINTFSQLIIAIEYSIKNRSELQRERSAANKVFFDVLDGMASIRAAEEIRNYITDHCSDSTSRKV